MTLDDINELDVPPALRDVLRALHQSGFKQYISPWQRIDASETYSFTHGLLAIPTTVDVLEATDSQGAEQAEASSVTVTKTVTIVSVANGGTARFFRVRAY